MVPFLRPLLFLVPLASVVTAQAQLTWQRTYGGYSTEQGNDVVAIADGSFVVVGSTGSFGAGGGDAYLLRLDSLGERMWTRTYGHAGVEQAQGMAATADATIAVVGFTNSMGAGGFDGFLATFDTTGVLLTERTYGTSDWDLLYAVDTAANGYFLVGGSYGHPGMAQDLWVLRVDASGDTVWTRTWGGAGEDVLRSVKATADGGCVVAGSFTGPDCDLDAVLVKLDAFGAEEWTAFLGGDSLDVGSGVALTADGGYFLGGTTESFTAHRSMLLGRCDAYGSVLWTSYIGLVPDFEGGKVFARNDGALIMTGWTNSFGGGGKDMYILFTDGNGIYIDGTTFGGAGDDTGSGLAMTVDSGFVLAGTSSSFGPGQSAVFVVRTDTSGFTDDNTVLAELDPLPVTELLPLDADQPIHPNPALPGATVTVRSPFHSPVQGMLVDALGRTCWSGAFAPGKASLVVPDVPVGMYRLVLRHPDQGALSLPLLVVAP